MNKTKIPETSGGEGRDPGSASDESKDRKANKAPENSVITMSHATACCVTSPASEMSETCSISAADGWINWTKRFKRFPTKGKGRFTASFLSSSASGNRSYIEVS